MLPLDSAVREEKCKTGGWAPTRAPGLCGSSTVVADDRNRLWTSPPGTHAWFLIARIGAVEEADSDRWLVLLTDSEERPAELGGSPDPVARRQIVEALFSKGKR